ncbi:MAG: hypothetical protein ACXW61_04955 [Gemmatirosa sp.]
MPRALAIRYLTVDGRARDAYRARLAERTASARANGYHLWAFAQEDAADRMVEFIEAGSPSTLATALVQDALLGEALDFRTEPEDDAGEWQRFVGLAGAS